MSRYNCKEVGFFRETKNEKSYLPFPGQVEEWEGWRKVRKVFVRRLAELQTIATTTAYKGWSTCRCCKAKNGSLEYMYKGYKWPSGYLHYIIKHGEIPEKPFWEFVVKATSQMAPIARAEKELFLGKQESKRVPMWNINVVSSNIKAAKFRLSNNTSGKLLIEFSSGSRYVYNEVSIEDVVEFTLAESQGKWFHANIRKYKKGRRIQ